MVATDTFKAFCHNCEATTEQWLVECDDEILINDKPVTVHLRYYHCLKCKEDYEVPTIDYDSLADAYLKLGMRSNEELIVIVDVLKIAMNIKDMRQWLNQADYG
jgi:hypothetical protein